ncbi:MAG: phosphoglucosamine mutase [Desulfobacterales bacterium CG23_combo_of_CG06-09_8_20_14_all_51_8]|nr:MAG: phosphoglucosamine mutase [Desulfobacterales bacterium CG23_combo_of_CG06-09_8_20_14_all_51_8]
MKKTLFGTDGIRGIANEYPMTPEIMVRLGRAIVAGLPDSEGEKRIIIGKDTRLSGDMIESALSAGICSMNGDVFLAGVLPTPAIACLAASGLYDAGIVISASHNPFYDNGIKIFNRAGFKVSDDIEAAIEDNVLNDNFEDNRLLSNDIGIINRIESPGDKYIAFLKNILPPDYSLKGLRIILDCANGATYQTAPKLFADLGAEIKILAASPDGTNINENCGSQHTQNLREMVLKDHANMGFAFDGDGDRLIAVDDLGNEITGDHILAVCAKYLKETGELKNNAVVSTVMSNVGLHETLKNLGIRHVIADVGDRHVLKAMQESHAVIGGEDSGHMIFLGRHTSGDGIFTALRLAQVIQATSQKLSDLVKIIKIYPQVLLNVPIREKTDISKISELSDIIKKVENALGERGRVLVRYSGTQPLCRVMVEGPDPDDTMRFCQDIADVITEKMGAA